MHINIIFLGVGESNVDTDTMLLAKLVQQVLGNITLKNAYQYHLLGCGWKQCRHWHYAFGKAGAARAWKHYIKVCILISSSWVWVEAMSTLTLCFWQSWCSTCVEILLLKCTLRRGSVASDADKLAKFITRTTYAYICMCECVCLRVSLCACVCVPMCFSPRQSRDRGKFTCKCALQVCL